MSVLLRPRVDARRVHVLTMAAAVALRAAVLEVAGVRAGVKWPNDLVVIDRKLAGVLTETELSATGDVGAVVIGVGCNVEWVEFPADLRETATACNLEAGHSVDRAELLGAFLDRLAESLDDLDDVPAVYRTALATLGRQVRVDLGDRQIEGTATDVDDAGRLVVTTEDGTEEVVAAGDVHHLRNA